MRRVAMAGALLIVGAALGGGGAYAGTVITSGQIKNGTIELKDLSPAAVRALRGKIGPPGKTGPAGIAGVPGTAGVAGASGVSGLELAQGSASGTSTAVASCPAGKKVVSGGFFEGGVSPTPAIARSAPAPDLGSWDVNATSGGGASNVVTAYAICAVVAP